MFYQRRLWRFVENIVWKKRNSGEISKGCKSISFTSKSPVNLTSKGKIHSSDQREYYLMAVDDDNDATFMKEFL